MANLGRPPCDEGVIRTSRALKFRDTNLLDRCHVVNDPRTLPDVVHRLIGAAGRPPQGVYGRGARERVEEGQES